MAVFNQGGGGGRAGTDTQSDQFSFDQPYEIGSKFTPETAAQINEMFRILFKSLKRGEEEIDALQAAADTDSVWTTVKKQANQSFNTGALENDTELTFTYNASANVAFRGYCLLISNGGAAGNNISMRIGQSNTAEANASWVDAYYLTTFSGFSGGVGLPSTTRSATQSAGVSEDGLFWFYGQLRGGSGGIGTVTLQFSGESAVASRNFTVRAGSWIEYTTVE